MYDWSKKLVHWQDETTHYWSIVFSWDLWQWAYEIQPELDGKRHICGGPAVKLYPQWVPEWVTIGDTVNALWRHCPQATRTSYGCIRKCSFCAVPKIEGEIKELDNWEIKPVVIDNNLLACSVRHFDRVIDSLKGLEFVDFNQGLDARLLTKHHAERFAELKNPIIRLAWDHIKTEKQWRDTIQKLVAEGINGVKNIRTYVLIGFQDTPEDALYRLQTIKDMGFLSCPMRYQPLDAKIRNDYVAPSWTNELLIKYMFYFFNQQFCRNVLFESWNKKAIFRDRKTPDLIETT